MILSKRVKFNKILIKKSNLIIVKMILLVEKFRVSVKKYFKIDYI